MDCSIALGVEIKNIRIKKCLKEPSFSNVKTLEAILLVNPMTVLAGNDFQTYDGPNSIVAENTVKGFAVVFF